MTTGSKQRRAGHLASRLVRVLRYSRVAGRLHRRGAATDANGRPCHVSLAVTHYNRPGFVRDAIRFAIHDYRFAEIVVYDDASDANALERLARDLSSSRGRVVLHRGAANLGAFGAKIEAVRRCVCPWVVLLDSDNMLSGNYLDCLWARQPWDPSTIYCPTIAEPGFDFRSLPDRPVTLSSVRRSYEGGISKSMMVCFLNAGNYFVHRDSYVACGLSINNAGRVMAADVIVFNSRWLRNGGTLLPVQGLRYLHRVHAGSYFLREWQATVPVVDAEWSLLVG